MQRLPTGVLITIATHLMLKAAPASFAAGGDLPAGWRETAGRACTLTNRQASFLLARTYPVQNLRLDASVVCTEPGTVLDCAGRHPAAPGAWTLRVLPDRRAALEVFAPRIRSRAQDGKGWHVFASRTRLEPGARNTLELAVKEGRVELIINDKVEVSAPLATPLAACPLYAGDFPGDNARHAVTNVYHGMVGQVRIVYLGPYVEQIRAADLAASILSPSAPPSARPAHPALRVRFRKHDFRGTDSPVAACPTVLETKVARADKQRSDVTVSDTGRPRNPMKRPTTVTEQTTSAGKPSPVAEGGVALELLTPRVTPGRLVKVKIVNPPREKIAWIGFYKKDAEHKDYIKYTFLNNLDNNLYDVTAPDEAGQYNFRVFRDESYKPLAKSETVEVETHP